MLWSYDTSVLLLLKSTRNVHILQEGFTQAPIDSTEEIIRNAIYYIQPLDY